MLTISRQGAVARIIQEIRDIPARVVPLAASTGLTRSAQAAQKAIVQRLPQVFDRPTAYTLNSTFIRAATAKTLEARVAVKDAARNNGTLPEDYLLPAVLGGGRKEKRFERAMRYAGILQRGERAVLGQAAPLDGSGNLRRGEIQRILTATRSAFDPYQRKTDSRRSRKNARNAPYFAGRVGRGRGPWGVWRREGRALRPVLIFVRKLPQYRARLDFEGIAEAAARETFPAAFREAVSSILRRNPRTR